MLLPVSQQHSKCCYQSHETSVLPISSNDINDGHYLAIEQLTLRYFSWAASVRLVFLTLGREPPGAKLQVGYVTEHSQIERGKRM